MRSSLLPSPEPAERGPESPPGRSLPLVQCGDNADASERSQRESRRGSLRFAAALPKRGAPANGGRRTMAAWRPDPSFYPSPRMAGKAPAETLAYVATFDPDRAQPDALAVVDLDPASPTYAGIVETVPMPNLGDELHHFGWNACSSCLCPNAPHPHVERRYLIVPGLRSSRIHVLDTKPDPRKPRIVQGDRAGGARRKDRLHAAAHGPLRSGRDLRDRARQRRRAGAGRHLPDGPRELRAARPLGGRPRPAAARLRRLVAPRLRHRGDERVGHCPTRSRTASCPRCCSAAATATSCTSGTCTSAGTCRSSTSASSTSSCSSCGRRTIRPRHTASSTA